MDALFAFFKFLLGHWLYLLPAFLLFISLFTVEEQTVAIVTRFGKFVRVAHSGLCAKIPFIDDIAGHVSLRVEQLVIEVVTKTHDNVFVTIKVAVQHVAMREKVFEAFYKLEHVNEQMESYVADAIRAQVPTLNLDELFERKDNIANAVQNRLSEIMIQYGWTIVQTLVTDIKPDAKVVEAMNDINAAQRNQEAAKARAEAERTLKVTAARAEAEAMALQGKGIADQRKEILNGLAAAVKELQEQIPGMKVEDIMAIIMLNRYFDTLQEVAAASNTNTIMLPNSPDALAALTKQVIAAMKAGAAES